MDGQDGMNLRRAGLAGRGILLFVATQLCVAGAYALVQAAFGGPLPGVAAGVVRLATSLLTLGLPCVYMLRQGKGRGVSLASRPSAIPTPALLPGFLLAMLVLNLLASLVREAAGRLFALPPRAAIAPPEGAALLLYFLSACLVPAVLEELLFRGVVQGLLRGFGRPAAILATGLLFALLHGAGWDTLTVFALGLALGWVREATGALYPGMVLHFANNLVAFGALVVQRAAPGLVWRYSAVLFLLAALGCLVAWWHWARRGRPARPCFCGQNDGPGQSLARMLRAGMLRAALLLCLVYFFGSLFFI